MQRKYKNKKVFCDGMCFDSEKEYKRWFELSQLEKSGQISELKRQLKFPLIVNDIKICDYICDFAYKHDKQIVIEDVKSKFTAKLPVFRIKKKLFEAIYNIEITEII